MSGEAVTVTQAGDDLAAFLGACAGWFEKRGARSKEDIEAQAFANNARNLAKAATRIQSDAATIADLTARLAEAEARVGQDWLDIASAPKDAWVLLFRPTLYNGFVGKGRWENDQYGRKPNPFWEQTEGWIGKSECRAHPPTHWMLLPNGPAALTDAPAEEGL